ncbi:MAG: hypothetical protein LBG52_04200 [Candidatus Peribacteria bacterium]|jgi:hypothetical protein|nr:hypothetical protein [Candidatus Peribacteria bacterium]
MTKQENTALPKNEVQPTSKVEKVVLKWNTFIGDELHKAGSEIEATEEVKKILKPFGYTFNS